MTAAILLGYVLLLAGPMAFLLCRAGWVHGAPRLGIVAWQVLSGSVLGGLVLLGLSLLFPGAPFSVDLAEFFHACIAAVRAQSTTPGGATSTAIGAVLVVAITTRTGFSTLASLIRARRERRRQLELLAWLGRPDQRLGALIVEHDTAVAYCVPGRGRPIVLTSAALAVLDEAELHAVLAHERAHLRERHDLVVAGALALEQAFPFVPTFRWARSEIARLVEMLADDAATAKAGRLVVARALVALAESGAPAAMLAAGGPTAVARVQRLLAPARRQERVRTKATGLVIAAALAAPPIMAIAPAIAAAVLHYCPLPALVAGPILGA